MEVIELVRSIPFDPRVLPGEWKVESEDSKALISLFRLERSKMRLIAPLLEPGMSMPLGTRNLKIGDVNLDAAAWLALSGGKCYLPEEHQEFLERPCDIPVKYIHCAGTVLLNGAGQKAVLGFSLMDGEWARAIFILGSTVGFYELVPG